MRSAILALVIAGWSAAANAQTSVVRKGLLETYAEINMQSPVGELVSTGISYGKRIRPAVRFKAGGMITIFKDRSHPLYRAIARDSITAKTWTSHASIYSLTAALEGERRFFKRVSLVAGLELRAGYGSGGRDSAVAGYAYPVFAGSAGYSSRSDPDEPFKMVMIGLRPYLGARLSFGRVVTGLDLAALLQSRSEIYNDYGFTDISWNPFGFHGRFTIGLLL